MTVSGLVITWERDASRAAAAARRLRERGDLTFGEAQGPRQPVVLETATSEDAEAIFRWIGTRPGVANVELACAYFDEPEDSGPDASGNPVNTDDSGSEARGERA